MQSGNGAMNCWKCGISLPDPAWGKLTFRASCDACNADLHCCLNCKYYKPGCPNDCMVPGTEYISDRSRSNLCEEFSLLGKPPKVKDPDGKKRFDDLFT